MEETIRQFKEHLRKMDAYNHAFGVLSYDSETAMPKGGSEHLGMTYAVLSEEMYKLTTSPELKAWVKEILAHREAVDYVTRREAEELFEDMERTEKIPMEEYVAYQVAQNAASHAWHTAKVTNDFALFAPHLETLVNYSRTFAGYWDSEKAPYDVLLDMYGAAARGGGRGEEGTRGGRQLPPRPVPPRQAAPAFRPAHGGADHRPGPLQHWRGGAPLHHQLLQGRRAHHHPLPREGLRLQHVLRDPRGGPRPLRAEHRRRHQIFASGHRSQHVHPRVPEPVL